MNIDAVVLFVDHADPHWCAERERSKDRFYDKSIHNHDSNLSCRYVSVCDEIIYTMKGIARYAEWIRTVFVVMATIHCFPIQQLHPNTQVILHHQLMPENALPTYSSNTIENSLHKIPGLSQHFIVFNDDVILTRPVFPDDFFTVDRNLPLYLFDQGLSKVGVPCVDEYGYRSMWKNSNRFLDQYFPDRTERRKKLSHSPFPMTRTLMENLWNIPLLRIMLEQTQNSHFRSIYDVNLICAIGPYFALYTDQAQVGHLRSTTLYLNDDISSAVDAMAKADSAMPHIICVESTITRANPSLVWLCHVFINRMMQSSRSIGQ